MSDCSLITQRLVEYPATEMVTALVVVDMAHATSNCYRLGARSVYTIQPRLTVYNVYTIQRYFIIKPHWYARYMYACLAVTNVTCRQHFWQNDRNLVRATAVTRGWNGRRNKSPHRKLILWKKFSRRSCRDSDSWPFDHETDLLTTRLTFWPRDWPFDHETTALPLSSRRSPIPSWTERASGFSSSRPKHYSLPPPPFFFLLFLLFFFFFSF